VWVVGIDLIFLRTDPSVGLNEMRDDFKGRSFYRSAINAHKFLGSLLGAQEDHSFNKSSLDFDSGRQ
jgi:hypothetical protein